MNLKPSEVRDLLKERGYKTTKETVIRWFHEGKFPNAQRVGHQIFIPKNEAEALIRKPQRSKPT